MAMSSVLFTFSTTAVMFHILLPFSSASPSMKYIDAVCDRAHDQAFCVKTLTSYPPTASPTGLLPMAEAVIGLGISHAEKTTAFIDEAEKKNPKLKDSFLECHKAYSTVVASLKSVNLKIKTTPDTATIDVKALSDPVRRVKELLGNNSDTTYTTLRDMTIQMEKLLDLAAGATDAVDDDDENIYRRV